jgi:hypothetical protein
LQNRFNFVVFVLSLDDLGRGSGEVRSVDIILMIRRDQGIVEDWMYTPCLWELEFAINSPGGQDLEWTMASRGKLGLGMRGVDVGSFQPD